LTSEIPYEKGRGFRYYLDAVGGADAKGWKKKAYIIYPKGGCGEFILVFSRTIQRLPGSQIIVPENRKLKDEYWEFVSIAGFWPV
jgi:hypothetical protein